MKRETSGHKAWAEVKFFEGKRNGEKVGREGFRNMVTGQEFIPKEGWNGAPPVPTGELVRPASDQYRKNYDEIRWDKPGGGEQHAGRE